MRTSRYSLTGKLTLLVACNSVVVAAIAAFAPRLGLPPASVFLLSVTIGVPLAAVSMSLFWSPARALLRGVTDGVRSFQENDFSIRLAVTRDDELGELVELYNRMGDVLRRERNAIFQRELLLDSLLQGAPMAIILLNERERVGYANVAARNLLGATRRLLGRSLSEVLESAPEEMRQALTAGEDVLFTSPPKEDTDGGESETYRTVRREFHVNTQRHQLLVVERVTPELRRQEVEVWKKVIRVMSHEMNNSLAPISSLLHSAQHVAAKPDAKHKLDSILETIDERVRHLCDFLEGYARFARLPRPQKRLVEWKAFLDGIQPLFPFQMQGEPPVEPAAFDPAQLQQVLINLLKNAVESGSPVAEIAVSVMRGPAGDVHLRVFDRGPGMDAELMKKALLPFYSSKQSGSGLGLPLCTEILSAHGGRLSLDRRPGGGTVVTCVLPA